MPSQKTEQQSAPAAEPPDKAAEPLPADLGGYYERPERWKDLPIYQCASCAYSRVGDSSPLARHVALEHRATARRLSGLVGPGGKPLTSTQGG